MKPSLISIFLTTAVSCAAFSLEASASTAQIDTRLQNAAQVAFTDATTPHPPRLLAYTDATTPHPPRFV